MYLPQRNLTHFTALNICKKYSAATSTHLMFAKQVLASAAHYSQTNRRTDSRLEGSCSSIHGTTKAAVAAGGSSHEPQWLPCNKSGDNRYAHPFVGIVQRIPRPLAACESCGASGTGLFTKGIAVGMYFRRHGGSTIRPSRATRAAIGVEFT